MHKVGKLITKKNIIIVVFLLVIVIGFIFIYNPYTTYFGFVQMIKLEETGEEYAITLSGDFGTRSTVLDEDEKFTVVENDVPREEHIGSI